MRINWVDGKNESFWERCLRKNRVIVSLPAVALALLLLVTMQAHSRPAEAVDSDNLFLPDLGLARLVGFQLEETSDGRKLLRFTSRVVNVGAGPFEAHGQRPDSAVSTITTQRSFDGTGLYIDRPTDAVMYYSGDGYSTDTCETARTSSSHA